MADQDNGNRRNSADGAFDVTIVGRLVADPELRYTPQGTAVCNMRLAVNLSAQEGSEWTVKTVWVRITAWGQQAETCNRYLTKGSRIYAESSSRPGYDHESGNPPVFKRQDGTFGASYEFTATKILFLGGGQRNEPVGNGAAEEVIPF